MGGEYPLWVVTNLFWVDQLKPKEGQHYQKIINHPKRMVTTHRGQSSFTEAGHQLQEPPKNVYFYFYHTMLFVKYLGLKILSELS